MAEVKGQCLGQYSGKIGNLVARIIRGRTFLSQRPTSYQSEQFTCNG